MTILELLLVGAGGFIGAIFRYFISNKFNGKFHMPFGTLFVNLVGSLLIGIMLGLALPTVWTMFLVSGCLGALTTFSTLQKEVIEQWQNNKMKNAIGYILMTYGGGILLAMLGFFVSK